MGERENEHDAEPSKARRRVQMLDVLGIVLIVAFLGISLIRSLLDSDGHMARETMDKFRRLAVRNGPRAVANVVPPLSFTAEEPMKIEPVKIVCEDVKAKCCSQVEPKPEAVEAKPQATEKAAAEKPAAAKPDECLEARKQCCPEFRAPGVASKEAAARGSEAAKAGAPAAE